MESRTYGQRGWASPPCKYRSIGSPPRLLQFPPNPDVRVRPAAHCSQTAAGWTVAPLMHMGSERRPRDVRTGLWAGQMLVITVRESRHSFVVALAHEVGLAHGRVRKRRIKASGRKWKNQQSCYEAGEEPEPGERHGAPLAHIPYDVADSQKRFRYDVEYWGSRATP
jgi:hypothetical protein